MDKLALFYPELVFDKFFRDFLKEDACISKGFPVYDVWTEKDGTTKIEFALAGYSIDDLSIEVENNQLLVSANKSDKNENNSSNRRIAKRSFKEVFTDYKGNLALDQISATFNNGILHIEIPTKEKNKSSKVEIKLV